MLLWIAMNSFTVCGEYRNDHARTRSIADSNWPRVYHRHSRSLSLSFKNIFVLIGPRSKSFHEFARGPHLPFHIHSSSQHIHFFYNVSTLCLSIKRFELFVRSGCVLFRTFGSHIASNKHKHMNVDRWKHTMLRFEYTHLQGISC